MSEKHHKNKAKSKKQRDYDPVQAEIDREFPLEYTDPEFEIGDIFRRYGETYRASHALCSEQLKAMEAIETCRTQALGGHVGCCEDCGHIEISYNSCRNRNCPKCRGSQRMHWVDAREEELLPVQYFHVVFTLAQQLNPLARYNPKAIYDLLFRTAAETLQTFAGNQWDAKLGLIMALHTWGQTLSHHPHVHCIVPGCALKVDRSGVVRAPANFLFPVKALSKVFRGKFLDALDRLAQNHTLDLQGQPELQDPERWKRFTQDLRQRDWVVYAKPPIDKPEHLIRYLGRYINRIAISNHRIRRIDHGKVAFDYKDYRDGQQKVMELDANTFIQRFLSHVPEKGFRQVRYFGFMANSLRNTLLILIRSLLGLSDPEKPYIPDLEVWLDRQEEKAARGGCPACGSPHIHPFFNLLPFHDPPPELLAEASP